MTGGAAAAGNDAGWLPGVEDWNHAAVEIRGSGENG